MSFVATFSTVKEAEPSTVNIRDMASRGKRQQLSGPGMRTFLAIADLWGLHEADRILVLGSPARSTFHKWAAQARKGEDITLSLDQLTRISVVLGIHKALTILFERGEAGIDWLRSPHTALPFGGAPPLHLATSGSIDGLLTLRRFLDGARGGIYMPPSSSRHFPPIKRKNINFR